MQTPELFLLAMVIIFAVPYAIWRLGRTDYFAPLVVVQIVTGVLLGPGVLGAFFPQYYKFIFTPHVIDAMNGTAWWAVMMFVWVAGIELDLRQTWKHRGETATTASLALGTPLLAGSVAAAALLVQSDGWIGLHGSPWQFVLGVGMACAVTALPILVLFMEKLSILRTPLGQRILRYASLDDVAIWGILAFILMDWARIGAQLGFILGFLPAAFGIRECMRRLCVRDRWYVGLVWLAGCGLAADASGLHFMVGAYLSGAVLDAEWFDHARLDVFRHNILLAVMPVFFLSTGMKTAWNVHGGSVFIAALLLLAASVAGKLIGLQIAGRVLHWKKGDAYVIGWLLQTKALIMIIFTSILLDKQIITHEAFTALLLMAVASTMLTVPAVAPRFQPSLDALAEPSEA
jgi:Kef-type K+ transport system membrane component KefB